MTDKVTAQVIHGVEGPRSHLQEAQWGIVDGMAVPMTKACKSLMPALCRGKAVIGSHKDENGTHVDAIACMSPYHDTPPQRDHKWAMTTNGANHTDGKE